tara:strand:+ start:741 stop:1310 length:570 start_codon:yes stop_codon:yes gene_type:complete
MSVPDITSSSPRPTALPSHDKSARKGGDQELGAEDFLKILTIQLTHQNPLDPMKDTEFISQMSQFNELEQSRELAQTMKAHTYLGKKVSVVDISGGREHSVTGLVTAFERDSNGDKVVINGNKYSVSNIRRVELVEAMPVYSAAMSPRVTPSEDVNVASVHPEQEEKATENPIAEVIGEVVEKVLETKV